MLSFVALVGNAGVIVAMADGAVTAPAPTATQSAIPEVDPFFMLSRALLKDSFDRPQLDTNLWSRPQWLVENHKTIDVKIEDGHLLISGLSRPKGGSHSMRAFSQNIFETLTLCSRPRCRFSHLLKAAGESSTWFICAAATTLIFSLR